MENYKIRVNNEAESKEAQELFFELGYEKSKQCQWLIASCIQFLATDGEYLHCWDEEKFGGNRFESLPHKEITLPQLRDLVVLKRNDVKDANYKLFISPSQGYLSLYKASDDVFYAYAEKSKCWDKSRAVDVNTKDLEPIDIEHASEEKAPALISGAEAKLAWANGKEVEYRRKLDIDTWIIIDDTNTLGVFSKDQFIFRLKPQTVKVELELPKPFEPKDGDECFILDQESKDGFYRFVYGENSGFHKKLSQFGVWRNEKEIKQVVEQLRKIKGAV